MILYNTLMGVCAGGGMVYVAHLLRQLSQHKGLRAGAGFTLLALGVPLTVLAGAMTLTWPLNVNPPINIAFGEPSLMLGVLMVLAGITLAKYATGNRVVEIPPLNRIRGVFWVLFCAGLILAATSSAIFSYNLVGDAPPQEPITGQFTGWENTAFGVVYALAALGCLLTPFLRDSWHPVNQVVVGLWMVSGVAFLLFSALNYRTHIGLLINIERGTNYEW